MATYNQLPIEVRRRIQGRTATAANAVALQTADSALYRQPDRGRGLAAFSDRLNGLLQLLLEDDIHQLIVSRNARSTKQYMSTHADDFSPYGNSAPAAIPQLAYGRPYVILPSRNHDNRYILLQSGKRSDNLTRTQLTRFFSAVLAQHMSESWVHSAHGDEYTAYHDIEIVYTMLFQVMDSEEDVADAAEGCWFAYHEPDWGLHGPQRLLM